MTGNVKSTKVDLMERSMGLKTDFPLLRIDFITRSATVVDNGLNCCLPAEGPGFDFQIGPSSLEFFSPSCAVQNPRTCVSASLPRSACQVIGCVLHFNNTRRR